MDGEGGRGRIAPAVPPPRFETPAACRVREARRKVDAARDETAACVETRQWGLARFGGREGAGAP